MVNIITPLIVNEIIKYLTGDMGFLEKEGFIQEEPKHYGLYLIAVFVGTSMLQFII